jgi:hypothetical protein
MAHVTINDTIPQASFSVGGTPSAGPFNLGADFTVFDPSTDLVVYVGTTLATYSASPSTSSQYSFSGTLIEGGYQGGSITLGAAVSNTTVSVRRDVPIKRTTDFPYPSATVDIKEVNTQIDRLFAHLQDRELDGLRALRQPASDAANIGALPAKAARANAILAFDANGDPLASAGVSSVSISAAMQPVVQAADLATARTNLGLGALATLATVGASQIDNDAVTYAKIQNVSAASRLLGRGSAGGAGDTEEISLGTGLSLSGTTLSSSSNYIKQSHAEDATYGSTAGTIPWDDTIPQSTEGGEALTLAHTPSNAANILVIECIANVTRSAGGTVAIMALFKDSDTNALKSAIVSPEGVSRPETGILRHRMTAGTTSTITFKLRLGGDSGTTYWNGDSSARRLGGVLANSILVREYAA